MRTHLHAYYTERTESYTIITKKKSLIIRKRNNDIREPRITSCDHKRIPDRNKGVSATFKNETRNSHNGASYVVDIH